jgi:predicted DNA-binding transcriptional regulator YafY
MTRQKRSITLSIEEQEKAQLEQLALEFGQTWGSNKPNVSKMVKAIAQGKLRLAKNHDWSCDRIDTLNRILGWLKDDGQVHAALELAQLLLERNELSNPLRHEIQTWVNRPSAPWRVDLERCIRQQRPFRLTYQDAAERLWTFTVRHAIIERHEDRQYLDCWCDETEGNQDIEALQHNWSLRLDRIPEEANISQAAGTWQPELSAIPVEFHLLGNLAFGYRSKTKADIENDWLPNARFTEQQEKFSPGSVRRVVGDHQHIRRVVRRTHNTFWLFREIRRYGADCVLVGPKEVRERFTEDVRALYQQYFSSLNFDKKPLKEN